MMRSLTIQSYSGKVAIFPVAVLILAFVMPFFKKAVPAAILLMVLTRIIEQLYAPEHFRKPLKTGRTAFQAMIIFYLLHAVGMLWSENLSFGRTDLEFKLSMLVLPLLFFPMAHRDARLWVKAGIAFTLGYLAFAVLSLLLAFVQYLDTGELSYFFYSDLSLWFHPSYQAMYGAWVVMIAGDWMIRNPRWWQLVIIAFVLIYMDLLSSKAGILSGILAILLVGVMLFRSVRSKGFAAGFVLGALVLMLGAASVLPRTSKRISAAVEAVDATPKDTAESTGLRNTIWRIAANEVISNPLGVGTGDVKDHLVSKYEEAGATQAAEKKANPHNQYLQTGVALGWLGLILLLGLLVWPAFQMLRFGRLLQMGFFLLIGFNLLFESMLEVQSGVVFFALWFVLLLNDLGKPESGDGGSESELIL